MQIRVFSLFLLQISAIGGQMRAHLTNCVHIWSVLVGLTKCAVHLGKRAAQLAKCARVWPNARAIYQTLRIWSNAARLTNWSNALRVCPNAQIGQNALYNRIANPSIRTIFLTASMWHILSRLTEGRRPTQLTHVCWVGDSHPSCN